MENAGVQESQFSYNIHMNATLSGNYIKRAFCVKTNDPINGKLQLWPIGTNQLIIIGRGRFYLSVDQLLGKTD